MTTHDAERADLGVPEVAADITPDEIDGSYVPSVGEWNVPARIDDEVLVVDNRSGQMNLLNSTAGTILECLDGEVSVDELAGELAEAFRAEPEVVRADVLGVVQELARRGMLDGVSSRVVAQSPAASYEAGELLSRFGVRRYDGLQVSIPVEGAGSTLLVNWSPFCGYCGMIVPDLAASRAGLAERGIELVLLTRGNHDDNLPMVESAGLVGHLAFRVETSDVAGLEAVPADPFGAMGTPAALLLDAAGRLVESIAMGAYAVPRLVRTAAGLPAEPEPAQQEQGDSAASPTRTALPAASGMCAPSPGGSRKPARVWFGTSAYAIGQLQVGVRADSARSDEILAQALAAYRLPVDVIAPDNYSVVLGGSAGAVQALSLLLAGDRTVVRSRSPRRVLRALGAHLSALVEELDPVMLETSCVPMLVDGEIAFLPPSAGYLMDHLQPWLARRGIAVSDEPRSRIDPITGDLVIPEPSVEVAQAVLDDLPDLGSTRSELPALAPGRYRVRAWIFDDDRASIPPALTRAAAVAGVLPCVFGEPDRLPELIDAVSQLLKTVRAVPMRVAGKEATAAFLGEYLGEGGLSAG